MMYRFAKIIIMNDKRSCKNAGIKTALLPVSKSIVATKRQPVFLS